MNKANLFCNTLLSALLAFTLAPVPADAQPAVPQDSQTAASSASYDARQTAANTAGAHGNGPETEIADAGTAGQPAGIPAYVRVSPPPGRDISSSRPSVRVSFKDPSAVRFESTRLWINGSEVSASCLKAPQYVSYIPLKDLPAGTCKVKAEIVLADGSTGSFSWEFSIMKDGPISSFEVTSKKELGLQEDFTVRMTGAPGGRAWFDIKDFRSDIPMAEELGNPGTYTGFYRVKYGESCLKAEAVGHMEAGGKTYSKTAPQVTAIWAQIFQVVITEPKEGAEMPLNFKIKGRTLPNCNISIVPKIGFSDGMTAAQGRKLDINSYKGDSDSGMGTIPCTSDAEGNFEASYGMVVKLPAMRVVFTITATDDKGKTSVPANVWVKFK